MFKLKYFILISCCLNSTILRSQHISLSTFVQKVEQLANNEQDDAIKAYLNSYDQLPIVENNKAVFIVYSPDQQPYLLADFNGFLNPRYVNDTDIGKMKRIAQSSYYSLHKTLKQDAIVNYMFKIGNQLILDSLNSNQRMTFRERISYLKMSDAKELQVYNFDKKGTVINRPFISKIMNHNRNIKVYVPFGYDTLTNLSTIYFHDGSFQIEEMQVPQILDELIGRGLIKPVIAVFDDPVIRGKEYRGDDDFRQYLDSELFSYIDAEFRTSRLKKDRATIGFSRGGMSAFYISHNTNLFGKLGAFSPAILPTTISDFVEQLKGYNYKPDQVYLTGSIYDYIWYSDAKELAKYCSLEYQSFEYKELPLGHNINSWQTEMDNMLQFFFSTN